MKEVHVATYRSESLVLKSILESAGIDSEIQADDPLRGGIFSTDVMGARLYVRDEDTEDALALIADYTAQRAAKASNPEILP